MFSTFPMKPNITTGCSFPAVPLDLQEEGVVHLHLLQKKQHSSVSALLKWGEAVLRESRALPGTVTQGTGISCHHCCVTMNYSQEIQLIPQWCQAGITQLVWELWFIHFAQSRQAKQISEGSQVTWTLLPQARATAGCLLYIM